MDTSTFGAVHSIGSDLTRTKDGSNLHQNVSNSCDPTVSKLRENGHSTPTSKNQVLIYKFLRTWKMSIVIIYLYLICLFIATLVFQPIASIESHAAGSEKGRKGNVNQDNTMDSVVCSGQSSLSKRSRKSSTVHKCFLLVTTSYH